VPSHTLITLNITSRTYDIALTSMSTNKAEQAVAFAALILADESLAITPEKLQVLLKAAGIEDVEPIWTTLFAKALEGKDVKEILTKIVASEPTVGEAPAEKLNEEDDWTVNDGGKDKDGIDICEGSDDEDFGMDLFG
jgi:large subunit ribosomal protein LP1